MMVDKAFNGATFIEFWEGLVKDVGDGGKRTLHVIMDMPARASQQTSQGLAIEECRQDRGALLAQPQS